MTFTTKTSEMVDRLIEKGISKQEDREIIIYGLTLGGELLVNTLMAIALGFVFKLVFEAIVFLVSFSLVRTYAGGYHCKRSINCYLLSSGIVAIVLAIIKFTLDANLFVTGMVILLSLLSVFTIIKFAPIETSTKPLDKIEQKYFRKKMMTHLLIECVSMWVLLICGFQKYAYVICLGIVVTAGLVILQKIEIKLKRK